MQIQIEWRVLRGPSDPGYDSRGVLYAYETPLLARPAYLGKADRCSVWERRKSPEKRDVISFLRDEGIPRCRVLLGQFLLAPGRRLSSALITDTESLLINRLQPLANVQCRYERIVRPGLVLLCTGDWPYRQRFVDR